MTLGQMIWRAAVGEGCKLMARGPVVGRNLYEKARAIKRKRPKKAPSRDIDSPIDLAMKTGIEMSETQQMTAAAPAQANPLLKAWQTPFETPPFAEISAGAFPARLRAGLRRSRRRDRRHRARPGDAGLRQHHHRAGALRQAALQGGGGVLRPGVGALQSGAARDRQGGVPADGAALEPDHDERGAVRPDRDAARQARQPRSDRRGDAAAGAHLYPLPPRRRRPRRGGQEADGRDQRAAGPSRHRLQPPSARRRAGLVHGAAARPISPACPTALSPPPGPPPASAAWPARRS